jgi:hypothetical protein
MFSSLRSKFRKLEDPRVKGRAICSVEVILTIIARASTAGCRGWKSFHNYAKENLAALRDEPGRFLGRPSEDAFSRVVKLIGVDKLNEIPASVGPGSMRRGLRRKP